MRAVRLVLTLLIAGSLAMLPVSTAVAMSHASSAEMNMSASPDGEPCCGPAGADSCPVAAYCHLQLLTTEQPPLARPAASFFAPVSAPDVPGAALAPDPPPPRS